MADQLLEIAGYVRRMKDLGASSLTDSPRIYGEQVAATLVDASGNAVVLSGSGTAGSDAQVAANTSFSAVGIYNGTTIDRARDANTARDSAGTGLLGAGVLGWDSGASLYRRILSTTAGLLKVDGSGVTQPVAGTKTSNNAAPDGSNVGALTVLANAAAPSWTEGNLVPLSGDLTGKLRVLATSAMTGTPADTFAAPSAIGQTQTFQQIYNGTTYDRLRDANSTTNSVGTGLLGAAVLGWDGAAYQRIDTRSNGDTGTAAANQLVVSARLNTYNGATYDRARDANTAATNNGTGLLGVGPLVFDGTNYQKWPTANNVQATTGATIPASGTLYWDGTNWQRWAGTSGRAPMVSLQQVGNVEADALSNTLKLLSDNASNIVSLRSIPFFFNGTTWDRAREVIGDAQAAAGIAATHGTLWNGTNYDRTYTANQASNTTGTGLAGAGLMGHDGTNWQKLRAVNVQNAGEYDLVTVPHCGSQTDGDVSAQRNLYDNNNSQVVLGVAAKQFNGTNWDRPRGNFETTNIFTSAARTAAVNSADQTNFNGRGAHIIINITAVAGSPAVTFTVKGKDPISGNYYTILASTALAAVATTVLKIYPGITVAANLAVSDILPRTWRVEVTVGTADSVSYSVGSVTVL